MNVELLIDSEEFIHSLSRDLKRVRESVYLQTLSFEGDTAGRSVANLLINSSAKDLRIIVDYFTTFKVSDKLLWWPWNRFNPELRREVEDTKAMFKEIKQHGARLRICRDKRSWFHSYFATNHKKTILIDDQICYLGGINLCDHNFAWHDLMFRFDDPAITAFFKQDFFNTFKDSPETAEASFDGFTFYLFNGQDNEAQFEKIFELMRSARKSLTIISPYLSWPFTEILRNLSLKGIEVAVITPQANNYPLLRRFISSQFSGTTIKLKYYLAGMSHMKAMLIDEELLIAGSSNFDLLSYRMLKEIILVTSHSPIVEDFKERVLKRDIEQTKEAISSSGRRIFRSLEKGLDKLCLYFNDRSK